MFYWIKYGDMMQWLRRNIVDAWPFVIYVTMLHSVDKEEHIQTVRGAKDMAMK